MAPIRLFNEAKLVKTKSNVERWILCPTLKGKPFWDKVILSTIVQLKIRSSSFMQDPRFFGFQKFVENSKVPFMGTIKVTLLNRVYAKT